MPHPKIASFAILGRGFRLSCVGHASRWARIRGQTLVDRRALHLSLFAVQICPQSSWLWLYFFSDLPVPCFPWRPTSLPISSVFSLASSATTTASGFKRTKMNTKLTRMSQPSASSRISRPCFTPSRRIWSRILARLADLYFAYTATRVSRPISVRTKRIWLCASHIAAKTSTPPASISISNPGDVSLHQACGIPSRIRCSKSATPW